MRRSGLLLCFLCSACVFNEEYPDDWSPIVVGTTECPDISGTYEDVRVSLAAGDYPSDYEYRLSEYFLKERLDVDGQITISQPDEDRIQANVHGKDMSDRAHTLSRDNGDYACQDGMIWLSDSGLMVEQIMGTPIFGVDQTRWGFAKAVDGSLVGEMRIVEAGLMFVIVPVAGSTRNYVLWRAAELTLMPK